MQTTITDIMKNELREKKYEMKMGWITGSMLKYYNPVQTARPDAKTDC